MQAIDDIAVIEVSGGNHFFCSFCGSISMADLAMLRSTIGAFSLPSGAHFSADSGTSDVMDPDDVDGMLTEGAVDVEGGGGC